MLRIVLISIFALCNIISYSQNYGNPKKFVQLLNQYRMNHSLPAVGYDPVVEQAAKIQCEYNNLDNNEGSHYNPKFHTCLDRLNHVNYKSNKDYKSFYCVENAITFFGIYSNKNWLLNIEQKILQAYIDSPINNNALLNPKIEKIGFYTIYDGEDIYNVLVLTN